MTTAPTLARRFYKRGDQIDVMSVAGDDMWKYSAFGISADVFMTPRGAQCPLISSERPGSGNLDQFLALLKDEFGSTLLFVSVINPALGRHLTALGIPWERA